MRYAQQFKVDGVLCGHIHRAGIREIQACITYYNCGDFVESCTALVEHADGRIELLTDLAQRVPSGEMVADPAEEKLTLESVLPGLEARL